MPVVPVVPETTTPVDLSEPGVPEMPSEPDVPDVTDAAVHMPKTVGVHLISAYIVKKRGLPVSAVPVSAEVWVINLTRKSDCPRVLSTAQAMGLGNFGISNPKLLSRRGLLSRDKHYGLRRRGNSLPTTASTSTRLRSK